MKRSMAFCGISIIAVVLSGCAMNPPQLDIKSNTKEKVETQAKNTNPQKGWVEVQAYENESSSEVNATDNAGIWKSCDGVNLMYLTRDYHNGITISVLPNSPECAG